MCRAIGSVRVLQHAAPVGFVLDPQGCHRDALGDDDLGDGIGGALAAGCFCCSCPVGGLVADSGMRRVRVKKLVHFVKNLRRGAQKPLSLQCPACPEGHEEKPWWKMLVLHSGMERLRLEAGVGAGRPERQSSHASHASHARRAVDCAVDRAVRLAAVSTDLQLDLPPSIALPDGEEYPYGASTRLHIRDAEQESEIYQKCIRPPPNRTVFDGESPPPYRPSSVGSSHGPQGQPPHPHPHGHVGLPAVIVPAPSRKQADPIAPCPSPALFLAGHGPGHDPGSGTKHSTPPSGPRGPPRGPALPAYAVAAPSSAAAAAAAAASGLARLLSPSSTGAGDERVVTVSRTLSRTVSRTAQSAEPVTACHPAVRDIPGAVRGSSSSSGSSHLAALTMVPCLTLTESQVCETTTSTSSTSSRTETNSSPRRAEGEVPRTSVPTTELARPIPRPPV